MTDETPKVLPLKKFMMIELIAAAIINGGIGAFIGWLVTKKMDVVPFAGEGGIIIDVMATAFLTGLLLTLIVTPLMRGRIAKGVVPKIEEGQLSGLMKMLPQNVMIRAFIMAIAGLVILTPLILLVFKLLGVTELPQGTFVLAKGIYGGVIGAIFTPFAMKPMMAGRIK